MDAEEAMEMIRPDFYLPSYEDCTDPEKLTSPPSVASTLEQKGIISIPPPPYSESSAELVSETNEQEQPPPYELCVWQLWQQQTADKESNPRMESNYHISMQEISHQQDTDSKRATPVKTSETSSQ
ncbi:hypothetical protein WISP_55256 [Willisornis vidua]|uniref:Uncharacterized protein n=1 Tax=Willisornis vidua TaxID=1566151 RepID=A0ABQ9DCX3_9PASS|nr:hypothetical protein WISP_55256 [Willisornis vidua]